MSKKIFNISRKKQTYEQFIGNGTGSTPSNSQEQSSGNGQMSENTNGEPVQSPNQPENKYTNKIDELQCGSKFYGSITTCVQKTPESKPEKTTLKDMWEITKYRSDENIVVKNRKGEYYTTSKKGIEMGDIFEETKKRKEKQAKLQAEQQRKNESETRKKNLKHTMSEMPTEERIDLLIDCGIKNMWMVGPAGCGKSTIARNVANNKELPYLCISCGIGTSAAEFVGYKYPERESTKFAEYYAKPSIILIDEMTALEPAVAQVLNAALANDEIETTTGLVKRHKDCIIIATSNTFGNGADRQYVANNQLDSSTLDRFVGGIIEVDYSEEYESQFDVEVVEYVHLLRKVIKHNELRRIASTRLIISGHKLKDIGIIDWKSMLITNWSDSEKDLFAEWISREESKMEMIKTGFTSAKMRA